MLDLGILYGYSLAVPLYTYVNGTGEHYIISFPANVRVIRLMNMGWMVHAVRMGKTIHTVFWWIV
jgi:hypothetical protein